MKLCISLLCILMVLLIVLVWALFFYDRSPEQPAQTTPSIQQSVPTTVTLPPETTQITTLPVTEPITEPATEPPTEPTTEPATEPTEETTVVTEPVITDVGLLAAMTAMEQVGKPYQYGSAGPDSFDASGLLYYCFKSAGISIPRNTKGQAGFGESVMQEDLRPGDAVFFWSSNPGEAEYVTIYIGNGECIACLNSSKPVYVFKMTTSYYQGHFVYARRFY